MLRIVPVERGRALRAPPTASRSACVGSGSIPECIPPHPTGTGGADAISRAAGIPRTGGAADAHGIGLGVAPELSAVDRGVGRTRRPAEEEAMAIRIGEILVQRGLLREGEVEEILRQQRSTHRPFGVLAEDLFGVSDKDVEEAWVQQYATIAPHLDPTIEEITPEALAVVTRRQAWQFKVVPIRYDGPELMVATTVHHLAKALRFASRCLTVPCYIVIAEADRLGEALVTYFPMGGLTPEVVESGDETFRT